MTAVVESVLREGVLGQLKVIIIQSDANVLTGHTIDLNSDVADAKGRRMKVIHMVSVNDDEGLGGTASFVPGTGVITLGKVSSGAQNITIIGR